MPTVYYPSTPHFDELIRCFKKSSGLTNAKAHAALLRRGLEAAFIQDEILPKLHEIPEKVDELRSTTLAIIDTLDALHKSVDVLAKSQARLIQVVIEEASK